MRRRLRAESTAEIPWPPIAADRFWRRRERRAQVGYQRDILSAVHRLVAAHQPILAVRAHAAPPTAATELGSIDVTLPEVRLRLLGITPGAQQQASALTSFATLADAGRYGGHWWVKLAGAGTDVVVLAAGLELDESHGGTGPLVPSPADLGAAP